MLVPVFDLSGSESNAVLRAQLLTYLSLVKELLKSSLVEGEKLR
jgi:hypothetical protein